jgi:hypothetical protein
VSQEECSQWDSLDLTHQPHPRRCPVQQGHILNVGGGDDDALSLELIIFLKLYQTFYFD